MSDNIYPQALKETQKKEKSTKINRLIQIKKPVKFLLISLIFGGFMVYRLFFYHSIKKNCVVDHLHQLTFGINRWINSNIAHVFLALGQILMDVNVLAITIYWVIFVKNFRFPVVIALFFSWRAQIFKIYTMPFTSYVVWSSPGFPSLTVAYDHTSDYFYSGHTGTAILLFLQSKKLNLSKWLQIWLFMSIFYMIAMLITVRVHYTTDVFGGVIYSLFFYQIVNKYLVIFDHIMNAPHRLVDIVKQKVQDQYRRNQNQGTSLYEIGHN